VGVLTVAPVAVAVGVGVLTVAVFSSSGVRFAPGVVAPSVDRVVVVGVGVLLTPGGGLRLIVAPGVVPSVVLRLLVAPGGFIFRLLVTPGGGLGLLMTPGGFIFRLLVTPGSGLGLLVAKGIGAPGVLTVAAVAAVAATKTVALVVATVRLVVVRPLGLSSDTNTVSLVTGSDSLSVRVTSAVLEVLEGTNAVASVLLTLVAAVGVLELLEVGVAATDASDSLDISGVGSLVGDTTSVVVVVLGAEVVVVGSVVPGTKVVGPATVAVVGFVLIAV